MQNDPVITIIGAGSPTFTPSIVSDLCKYPSLSNCELRFYDISQKKLSLMTAACSAYLKKARSKIRIIPMDKLNDSVRGADFVINAALQNGWDRISYVREQIRKDLHIDTPIEAHASFGQLDFLLSIAKVMEKECPDATLIQCANPMSESGTLITKLTKTKFIGVCHGYKKINQLLGLLAIKNDHALEMDVAGINHNIWLLNIKRYGVDLIPRIKEWSDLVSRSYIRYARKFIESADYQISPAAIKMFQYFGSFPVGDTCRASQPHMWMWHRNDTFNKKMYGLSMGRDSMHGFNDKMNERNEIFTQLANLSGDNYPFLDDLSEWQIIPIVDSIITNNPTTQIVNVPNNGAIVGLPDDLVVEIQAIIDRRGARPKKVYEMPKKVLLDAIRPHSEQVFSHVNAYINKDINILLDQILRNRQVKSMKSAKKILNIWLKVDPEMSQYYGVDK